MPCQPLAHLRMLVGCVVVDDGVDRFWGRHLRLDGIEEADELLVPVSLHVAADDGAVEDVEGGEQRGCAVTFVVVGHRSGAARLHRQTGLGAVERLDLALLIDRKDDGMGVAEVQWVASPGGSVWVSVTTRSVMFNPSGRMREGRVLSNRRPS